MAENVDRFTFIDLFAGIGGIRLAFESAGGECVFASEWDEDAQKTYAANFGHVPDGDITRIPSEHIPDHDILTDGFPCQPFSIIGNGLGFSDTRGTLFFEIERILRDKQPSALLLENVKQFKSHDKGRTFAVVLEKLESLGYYTHYTVLNALDFGLPQKRERTYIVGFKENYAFTFPSKPINVTYLMLKDILEPDENVPAKYYASERIQNKRLQSVEGKEVFYPSIWHENKGGNVAIHPFSCALRAGASFSYLLVNGTRRLTPREQLRLQGFPDTFKIIGTETKIRRQTGNSVPVKVVEAIAHKMIESMNAKRFQYGSPQLEHQLIRAWSVRSSMTAEAKQALDNIISKARVHFYKPIQIAEILYRDRLGLYDFDIESVETYRNISKRWRDEITTQLVGRVSTSSQKYQDNLFEPNAMPPHLLKELALDNRSEPGIVENYIYHRLAQRYADIEDAYRYLTESTPEEFSLTLFLSYFESRAGLRRSVDKEWWLNNSWN